MDCYTCAAVPGSTGDAVDGRYDSPLANFATLLPVTHNMWPSPGSGMPDLVVTERLCVVLQLRLCEFESRPRVHSPSVKDPRFCPVGI